MANLPKPKKAKGGSPQRVRTAPVGGRHTPGAKARRKAQTTDSNNAKK